MIEMFEAQWPVLAAAAAVLLLAIWLLVRGRKSKPRERHRAPDALDEGAAPAARNQALIDAPSSVTVARAGDVGVLGQEAEPVATTPPPVAAPAPQVESVKFAPAPKAKPKAPPKAKSPPQPSKKAEPKAESKPTAKAALKPKAEPKPKPKAETKAEPKPAAKPKAAPAAKAAPKPKSAPKPKPVAVAATPPPPPPVQLSGNLAQIKGLGPKLQALLPSLGLASVADVAAMSDADIDRIDAQLGVFAGRIRKDNWVEQAKLLAAGDVAGYEAKFGKL